MMRPERVKEIADRTAINREPTLFKLNITEAFRWKRPGSIPSHKGDLTYREYWQKQHKGSRGDLYYSEKIEDTASLVQIFDHIATHDHQYIDLQDKIHKRMLVQNDIWITQRENFDLRSNPTALEDLRKGMLRREARTLLSMPNIDGRGETLVNFPCLISLDTLLLNQNNNIKIEDEQGLIDYSSDLQTDIIVQPYVGVATGEMTLVIHDPKQIYTRERQEELIVPEQLILSAATQPSHEPSPTEQLTLV